ncbi:hypothetical protein M5K25_014537 [Dendrobium thyrsiflorum]|uniref:Uncharacterized protein n=1 Tax=Dendrobium thyrsiflorum TaxID=117978 RepID=A0ABD0UWF4_DENTH
MDKFILKLRDSVGFPAERQASRGGPAERRALGGGPAERLASGGSPAERRASDGGPTTSGFRWWSDRTPVVVEEEQGGQSDLRFLSWFLGLRRPHSIVPSAKAALILQRFHCADARCCNPRSSAC